MTMSNAILQVENLEVNYGMIKAVKGVSFEVGQGEIVALIGANGAGKTTIMHSVNGIIPKAGGKVVYDGKDITSTPAYKLASYGMAQVPEGRRIFQELTVLDNLRLGYYSVKDAGGYQKKLSEIYEAFPILKERSSQTAGTLSGGEQQMLAIGRAMMCRPKLLMLDEPSMGLAPIIVSQIFDIIKAFHDAGVTILLVEQNAGMALKIADRAYVLETGRIVMSGTGAELAASDEIKKAYLGG